MFIKIFISGIKNTESSELDIARSLSTCWRTKVSTGELGTYTNTTWKWCCGNGPYCRKWAWNQINTFQELHKYTEVTYFKKLMCVCMWYVIALCSDNVRERERERERKGAGVWVLMWVCVCVKRAAIFAFDKNIKKWRMMNWDRLRKDDFLPHYFYPP